MIENFDKAIEHTLKEEGGFVNHPSDPGGMTNLGVTAKVWEEWTGHMPDEKTMREYIVGYIVKCIEENRPKGNNKSNGKNMESFKQPSLR